MKLECYPNSLASIDSNSPVVFVHGAWHGAWCWQMKFVPYFESKGIQTVSFSFRNHGKSEKKKWLNCVTIQDYVDDLKSIVDQLKSPPILIAHSMGGMVVQKYLEKHSCKAAVLLASVPPSGVFKTTLSLLQKKWKYSIPSLLTLNLFGIVNTKEKAIWAFYHNNINEKELKEYSSFLTGESYRAFLDMLFPSIKVKHHLNTPMLVVAAEHDNIFTLQENNKTAKKYNAEFIKKKNTGHNLMLESNFQETANDIITWLKSKNLLN